MAESRPSLEQAADVANVLREDSPGDQEYPAMPFSDLNNPNPKRIDEQNPQMGWLACFKRTTLALTALTATMIILGMMGWPERWLATLRTPSVISSSVPSGKIRIRYKCACGARLWDDYPADMETQARNLEQKLDRHFRQVESRAGEDHEARWFRQIFSLVLSDLIHLSNSLRRRFSGIASRTSVDSESQSCNLGHRRFRMYPTI